MSLPPAPSTPTSPRRTQIGLLTCTSLLASNMIGTGIFTTLGLQVSWLPWGWGLLGLWVLGAWIALCGALAYAELAGLFPRSGGEYTFLSAIYHPSVGFAAGFLSMVVGFSAPSALGALAFGAYFHQLFPHLDTRWSACAVLTGVTAAHLIALPLSQVVQNVFTVLKISLVAIFIIFGYYAAPSPTFAETYACAPPLHWTNSLAIPLLFTLYAYSGWNAPIYILSEVKNPTRTVPLALVLGTLGVGMLYVALNAVFLKLVPLNQLANHVDVGNLAAGVLFGSRGGHILAVGFCVGLIASLSALTWTGPRVSQTMGSDFDLLKWLAYHNQAGIPTVAVVFQYTIALILLLTSTFESVLIYTQIALFCSSILTVIGVYILRWRQPQAPRPFRCWGYPWTPLFFIAVLMWSLIQSIKEKPLEALASLLTIGVGWGLYFFARRRT